MSNKFIQLFPSTSSIIVANTESLIFIFTKFILHLHEFGHLAFGETQNHLALIFFIGAGLHAFVDHRLDLGYHFICRPNYKFYDLNGIPTTGLFTNGIGTKNSVVTVVAGLF